MGLVSVRLQAGVIQRALAPALRGLGDMTPVMKQSVKLIRLSVAGEFLNRHWAQPSGGFLPWAPNVPWGVQEGPGGSEKKPLIASGKYYRALVQGGPGGFAIVTARTATVGVDLATFPYAPFVRGGVGALIRLTPLVIRAKKLVGGGKGDNKGPRQYAMFFYLGLTFGVWLSLKKLEEGIRLPPRPHLTSNPALTKQIASKMASYILKGTV